MSRPVYEPRTKRCPKCEQTKSVEDFYKNVRNKDGRQGYCIPCWKEKVQEWRKATPERFERYWRNRARRSFNVWREDHKLETSVHKKVARAIRNGILTRPEQCSECDSRGRVEAHHHDYEKPLEVTWLCPRCHRLSHLREHTV